ncbi:MAG: hypothetical protein R3C26_11875 [Calditrichia bacterium]
MGYTGCQTIAELQQKSRLSKLYRCRDARKSSSQC